MQKLFKAEINNWKDWANVFQSITAFEPLIKYIFKEEGLPFQPLENLTPGTNAVFKVGLYVVKVFAPKESGIDMTPDFHTELFSMNFALSKNINLPIVVANGCVKDKFDFYYIITKHINAIQFSVAEPLLNDREKFNIAKELRLITSKINIPCERFNNVDVVERALKCERYMKFPISFQNERYKYLKNYKNKNYVFVHGDLNPDNILVDKQNNLHIIDFADSLSAPYEYELVVLVCCLFCFEKPYLDGYLGNYNIDELTDKCLTGILLHYYGYNIICSNFGKVSEITSIDVLRSKIYLSIKNNKGMI
ncbi:MAG: hypothetical protein DBX47_00730 [Clostridiales bacterium]|nr:MAG: hypothetical protein DBX47_00730 [Clostridiales bacterium]